jgi:hypothetical protein
MPIAVGQEHQVTQHTTQKETLILQKFVHVFRQSPTATYM